MTMKKEKRLTRIIGSLLTAVLGILGFSGCGENDGIDDRPDMYGTPYGDFQISGIVSDEEGAPVDSARVISRAHKFDGNDHDTENGYMVHDEWYNDTVYTDAKGHYLLEKSGLIPYGAVMVVVQDPKGGYESTYREVKLDYKGESYDGWYVGKAEATVDFTLKKKEE